MSDLDEATKTLLLEKTEELKKLADSTVRAADGRRDLPIAWGDYLKKVSEMLGECRDAFEEHFGATLPPDVELIMAAVDAAHEGVDALYVFDALEGTVFSTETVAND